MVDLIGLIESVWPDLQISAEIGQGLGSRVYRAELRQGGAEKQSAVKAIFIPDEYESPDTLLAQKYSDDEIEEYLEARAQSSMQEIRYMQLLSDCGHIVRIEDHRLLHPEKLQYVVLLRMELLTPLIRRAADGVSSDEAAQIGIELCDALTYCHERKIVHRDIKPSNIFVDKDGVYKLGDFSVSKEFRYDERTLTMAGTPQFMAPELIRSSAYTGAFDKAVRTDIYSLGLVLYWLLNERRLPFLPPPPEKLCAGMEEEARLRRFNGEAIPAPAHGSEELKRIVLKACAFDPKDRYQNAEEMLRDLEALSEKASVPVMEAPVKQPVIQDTEQDETLAQPAAEESRHAPRSETQEEEDTGTLGVFGKNKTEASEDDGTVRASKTDENDESVNTEIDDRTVGAFDEKGKQTSPQLSPAPETESEVKSKPKRTIWPFFIGVAALAMLFVVCLQAGIFSLPTAKTKDGGQSVSSNNRAEMDKNLSQEGAVAFVAEGYCGDNIYWTLDAGGTLTINGTGKMWNWESSTSPWSNQRDSITCVVIQGDVTSIGDNAFRQCRKMKSVTIPSSVSDISTTAFHGCAGLANSDGFVIVNGILFDYYSQYGQQGLDVTIPKDVTIIGDWAFNGYNNLRSVTIPDSVTYIGDYAFSICESLTNITLPNNVIAIGDFAFVDCKNMESVTIPNSVESIGSGAFSLCSSLTDVYFEGSEVQWTKILFGLDNDSLHNATIHYNAA